MALYLMKCRFLQRSKGHSATGLGCYMLDRNAIDPWDGKEHKQAGRHDDADHEKMVAFAVSPCDDPFENPLDVFQSVDAFERRKDATLGKEYELALQHELTPEQNIEAVRQFCEQAKSEGLYCVAALHFKRGNWHAHIYESDRTFSVVDGQPAWGKKNNTQEANRERVERRRECWAAAVNAQFEQAGLEERIDHRSYRDRGLEWEREIPEGKNPSSDVQERNAVVRKARQLRNAEIAAAAQHEAAQAIAKAQELDNEIAEEILTDYIPPAQVARVPAAKNLPPVGVASMDAALALISIVKKKAPALEPEQAPKRDLPEIVEGLSAMRPKPKPLDDDFEQNIIDVMTAPKIVPGLSAINPEPVNVPADDDFNF